MDVGLNTHEAIEFLLKDKYQSEFEVIDRLFQHPEGLDFLSWLFRKGLISEKENQRIQLRIQQEGLEE